MVGWNVGGCSLDLLRTSLQALRDPELGLPSLLGLQEVRRGAPGWNSDCVDKMTLLSFQAEEAWRGTGILYDPLVWQVMRRKGCTTGSWYRVRHLQSLSEFWYGVTYISPHLTALHLHAGLQTMLEMLPATTLPCLLAGDVNAPVSWTSSDDRLVPTGGDGKGRVLLDTLQSGGFELVPPCEDQLHQPTSKPRKEGAVGRKIDWLACKRAKTSRTTIYTDSNYHLGTDHDALGVQLVLRDVPRRPKRVRLGPRVVTSPIVFSGDLDQHKLQELAAAHSGPRQSKCYKDDGVTKVMFQVAKDSGSAHAWKRAHRHRKEAHDKWKQQRVLDAASGDWEAVRSCRPLTNVGWEVSMAEALAPDDPHDALHQHYSSLFSTSSPIPLPEEPCPAPSPDFTEDELREALAKGKSGKSVGKDQVSLELLRAIADLPEGLRALLTWFNSLLHQGELPEEWLQTVMTLLPKVPHPLHPRDTRPISIGSATERVFSRMVLRRCVDRLQPSGSWQCAGPHKQTADYLYTIQRLLECEREWNMGLAVVKVDLAKAFDSVRRDVLLGKLRVALGNCEEFRVWRCLLTGTSCLLSSPWNQTTFETRVGIRQGAVESPLFFACIMEWALAETVQRYSWKSNMSGYPDLHLTQLAFMDDCLLWDSNTSLLEVKLRQFRNVLKEWGLSINLQKCGLYVSPKHTGLPHLTIDNQRLEAKQTLVVMGVNFKVGANSKDLLQGTWQRAKSKFWSIKHLLLSPAPIAGRLRLLHRVVGAAALWNVCAFPPEPNGLEALNQLLYQFVIWMLKHRKHGGETWVEFRQRTMRQARQLVWMYLPERWSTVWVRRWWGYCGHVARGCLRSPKPAPTILAEFRPLEWWSQEQRKVDGLRHNGRFHAKLCPLDGRMNSVCTRPWRETAMDRSLGCRRCLVQRASICYHVVNCKGQIG